MQVMKIGTWYSIYCMEREKEYIQMWNQQELILHSQIKISLRYANVQSALKFGMPHSRSICFFIFLNVKKQQKQGLLYLTKPSN
ncbi:unnamed protein product [Paramecium sonneborni]|uniref:Uncharacterized protein n=1 Tax=Paramecium sonneborni TaxID=65129 RepID=A0A8S1NBT1_9CILI|nr:unnamed protein product [Paramecium sonneborni]